MKIAAVTNDGKTINAHFGKALYFAIITVEDGKVVSQELRERLEKAESPEEQTIDPHDQMVARLAGCKLILSGGMGGGMFMRLQRAGFRVILTDIQEIDEAVTAFLEGRLRNNPDLVH
jgi:predicted Fe-Mo cluster-binding NifX family protein